MESSHAIFFFPALVFHFSSHHSDIDSFPRRGAAFSFAEIYQDFSACLSQIGIRRNSIRSEIRARGKVDIVDIPLFPEGAIFNRLSSFSADESLIATDFPGWRRFWFQYDPAEAINERRNFG